MDLGNTVTDHPIGFIAGLPKAELHMHIEGSLEPEMMFALARRNRMSLPFATVEALRAAYRFSRLQDFLDLYYQGAAVLRTEEDFHDLTLAYFDRAAADGVAHAEIFFDPQTHTARGLPFRVAADGVLAGMEAARARHGVSGQAHPLLPAPSDRGGRLRHAPGRRSHWLDRIVGRSDSICPNWAIRTRKFRPRLRRRRRERGLKRVAHAGEEGPPDYVVQALDLLHVDRIDHGNRALEDPALTARLAREAMTLTVCPLSNVRAAAWSADRATEHPIARHAAGWVCARRSIPTIRPISAAM